MRNYFIESFKITKLWGYRDIDLTFNNDVNILIGPNGSGKTTILNLLHAILSADLRNILALDFERVEIKLKGFKGKSVRTVKAEIIDRLFKLSVGQNKFEIDIIRTLSGRRFPDDYISSEKGNTVWERVPPPFERERRLPKEFYDVLTTLVPIVWLPVSRRLPITEDEEERYTRRGLLESVDVRLDTLLEGLFHYHSRLNTQLSERYREFERQVLSVILYNSKEHDQISSISYSLPTESEKKQLIGAFDAAGLLNKQMQSRIEEHFAAAEKVAKRIRDNVGLELEDILVAPLISRTKSMVEYARKLEKYRTEIFAPLRLYEDTVNSFLKDKTIKVDKNGHLKIKLASQPELNWHFLSSGEKQILILLTQALLRLDNPVVYMADEPELSLHVTWQEKLLESLVTLGGQKQIIVATHSPDIVGDFRDKVIDLGR